MKLLFLRKRKVVQFPNYWEKINSVCFFYISENNSQCVIFNSLEWICCDTSILRDVLIQFGKFFLGHLWRTNKLMMTETLVCYNSRRGWCSIGRICVEVLCKHACTRHFGRSPTASFIHQLWKMLHFAGWIFNCSYFLWYFAISQ